MATRASSDLNRVTVVTPTRWADVALPADIPLVDVLPALVEHVGDEDLLDRPVVVQRLGQPPLDEESSAAALGIVDGETLYLRPVEHQLPPIEFDDLVDGVAVGIREKANRWTPQLTKALFLGLAVASVTTAAVMLSLPGPSLPRAFTAGFLALVLILIAALLSRGSDTATTMVTACAAQPLAALSGLVLATGGPRLGGLAVGPENVFLAALALFLTALLSWLLVSRLGPVLLATTLVAALTGCGAALLTVVGWPIGRTAAVMLTIAVLLGQFLPRIAYPLARLRVPAMPAGPADLSSGIDPLPGEPLLNRVVLADGYLTALTCAVSLVATVAAVLTVGQHGWAGQALVAVCGTALSLRARLLKGRGQRIATAGAGVVCFQALAVVAYSAADQGDRVLMIGGLAALTLLALAGARMLPERRLSPHFSWAADVLETLTAMSILPLLFQIFGLYGLVRSIAG